MLTPGKSYISQIACILLILSSLANSIFTLGQSNPKDSSKTDKILYIGINNQVKISVPGVKKDLMEVSIDQGTIIGESGNYLVRPVKSGNAAITVKKKGKLVTTLNYEVKRIPDPMPFVKNHPLQYKLTVEELIKANSLEVVLPNCNLSLNFQITNFQMSAFNTTARQDSGQLFTNEQIQIIKQCKSGDKITFDDIKCKGMEGIIRNLPSLFIEIK